MDAEVLAARLLSTVPEAFAAFLVASAGLRLLRVRDPGLRSAVWTLALLDSLLPLADAGSLVLVTARIALAAGVPHLPGPWGPAALTTAAAVAAVLAARRLRDALRVERAAASLAALWPESVSASSSSGPSRPVVATPPGDGSPFVAGLLRPVVVVPAAFWARLTEGERHAVLGHEAAHARRGDAWRSLAEGLAADVLWFNPFVRVLASRAAEAREAIADRDAVRGGSSPADLARALVEAAAAAARRTPAGALAFCGRGAGPLERRLELLRRARRPWVVLAQAAGLVVLVPWSPAAAQNGVHAAQPGETRPGVRGNVTLGLAWRPNPVQKALLDGPWTR